MKIFNRITTILIIFLLCIITAGFICSRTIRASMEDEDTRVMVDSLVLAKDKVLYWYKYADMFHESSYSYMAVGHCACCLDRNTAAIEGDFILGIDTVRNDTIFILSEVPFQVNDSNTGYIFHHQPLVMNKQYPKHRISQSTYLSRSCK
ncbi:hypothetical protein SAMN05444266_108119 [Chitinophaga jiangningensis]|uniref:Uncharacterized protein n=1 Tax=Chitinophaga jiangningensis TaxID=1419482 RepID=A0A1M7IW51_9BACT|nr:hypothetical protein SAMN05444266_108119 [Chitinophaga jiangningensis]